MPSAVRSEAWIFPSFSKKIWAVFFSREECGKETAPPIILWALLL